MGPTSDNDLRATGATGERPRGVLLANLGSPSAPTPAAVRRFLGEFLADPLVVDLNPLVWWWIRNVFVLPLRSGRVAHAYSTIWTPQGSPLVAFAKQLAHGLERELGEAWRVAIGMRYGAPSLQAGLESLAASGCGEVDVLPLFPQYSRTTTGTLERALRDLARRRPDLPGVRVRGPYAEDPAFIGALARTVREALAQGPVDHVVFSYHGLPVRYVRNGDPYEQQCRATTRALVRELGLPEGAWSQVYQSRFGREPWLEPAADVFVPQLASRAPRVLIAMPGFAADCLETLEEIGQRLASEFRRAGGTELRVVPCLNDHPTWVSGCARLLTRPS